MKRERNGRAQRPSMKGRKHHTVNCQLGPEAVHALRVMTAVEGLYQAEFLKKLILEKFKEYGLPNNYKVIDKRGGV
jgi:hypothetical protein